MYATTTYEYKHTILLSSTTNIYKNGSGGSKLTARDLAHPPFFLQPKFLKKTTSSSSSSPPFFFFFFFFIFIFLLLHASLAYSLPHCLLSSVYSHSPFSLIPFCPLFCIFFFNTPTTTYQTCLQAATASASRTTQQELLLRLEILRCCVPPPPPPPLVALGFTRKRTPFYVFA